MHEFNDQMFDDFVAQHPNGNFMQKTAWAHVKSEWLPHRFMWSRNGTPIAAVQFLSRNGLWYAPKGPVMDYSDAELVSDVLRDISLVTRIGGAKYIKIDPPVLVRRTTSNNKYISYGQVGLINQFSQEGYEHQGFFKKLSSTIQPRYHMTVILNREFPDSFPKKTRRLIRDAIRKYVNVDKFGVEKLDDFMGVIKATEVRQGITLRNKSYFESLFHEFPNDIELYISTIDVDDALNKEREHYDKLVAERMHLGRAPKKYHQLHEQIQSSQSLIDLLNSLPKSDKPLVVCGALVISSNDSKEILYAGMNDEFAKFSGQYLTFATIMEDAKVQEFHELSMGGVDGDLCDSLAAFKSKFNPDIIEYYGEFDKPRNMWWRFLYRDILPIYQTLRKHTLAIRKNLL